MRPPVRRRACLLPRATWHIVASRCDARRRSHRAGVREPDAGTERDERPTGGERKGRGDGDLHPRERTGQARPRVGCRRCTSHPIRTSPQQRFKLDYAGGWGKYHKSEYWRRFKNVCRAYSGPALVYGVAACTAPDGTHWALQSWQRVQPLRGVDAFPSRPDGTGSCTSRTGRGQLAELEVSRTGRTAGRCRGCSGDYSIEGKPVYGFKTAKGVAEATGTRGTCTSTRFNSAYGPGWKRDGAGAHSQRQRRRSATASPLSSVRRGVPESVPSGPPRRASVIASPRWGLA